MNIVVVESPAKAKTINEYLGSDFKVIASYGHVRDLPSKTGSVNPDNNFSMIWEAAIQSKKHMADIAESLKNSNHLANTCLSLPMYPHLKEKDIIKVCDVIKKTL